MKHNIDYVSATNVWKLDTCLRNFRLSKELDFESSPIFTQQSNKSISVGTAQHRIIEKYFKTGFNFSFEEVENSILEELEKLLDIETLSLIFLDKITQRTFNILKYLKKFLSDKNFDKTYVEYSFPAHTPFMGIADILIRNEKESIIIDYKSGRIFNEDNEIRESIKKQLMVYFYLEVQERKEVPKVSLYVLDKKGNFHSVNCEMNEVLEFAKNIQSKLQTINENKSEINFLGDVFACNNCSFISICKEYKNINLSSEEENLNVISGKLINVNLINSNYMELFIQDFKEENLVNKFFTTKSEVSDNVNFSEYIGKNLTLKNIKFLEENNEYRIFTDKEGLVILNV